MTSAQFRKLALAQPEALESSHFGKADFRVRNRIFAGFMADHPGVIRICFNGATAERLFRRHVLPGLALGSAVGLLRLPSTSPAHAGMPYADKLRAWQVVRPGLAQAGQDTPSCASDQDPTSSMPRTTW